MNRRAWWATIHGVTKSQTQLVTNTTTATTTGVWRASLVALYQWIEGDLDLIPGLGRSPGEGNSYPLQYSDLENSMDSKVHGVAKTGHN